MRPGRARVTGRSDIAAALLRIELETRLLRQRADEPSLRHYSARMEAIDALLAHVALTARFLGEERLHAAAVGAELAETTYDLMRVDFEATIRGVGGSVRPACNKGLEWVGIGIQGLKRDPGWADRSEEVEQALGQARWHLDNAIQVAPAANILKAGVNEISHVNAAGSVIGLTRSGLAALARLATWMERGGAAFGVLQVAPAGGGAAIQLVTSGGALTLTHAEVMVLVNAGQLSATAAALHMMAKGQPPKLPQQAEAFEAWAKKLPTQPTPNSTPAGKYEISKTGPLNYEVKGAGQKPVWADGLRASDGHVLEAKFIKDPASSPYIDGSKCYEPVRAKVLGEMVNEFKRYAAVIRDPSNPVVGLEVIVSDARAVPFFERLMAQFSIPGQVIVSLP